MIINIKFKLIRKICRHENSSNFITSVILIFNNLKNKKSIFELIIILIL